MDTETNSQSNLNVSQMLMMLAIRAWLVIAAAVYNGFGLATMWRWFVQPLGLPALTILSAIGITALMRLFTIQPPHKTYQLYAGDKATLIVAKATPYEKLLGEPFDGFLHNFLRVTVGLSLGWCVHMLQTLS